METGMETWVHTWCHKCYRVAVANDCHHHGHKLSALRHQLSALCHQLSALWHQLSARCHQLSVLWHRMPACHELSALCHQLSVLWHRMPACHQLIALWQVDGAELATSGRLITVSPNFRVGPLGFHGGIDSCAFGLLRGTE